MVGDGINDEQVGTFATADLGIVFIGGGLGYLPRKPHIVLVSGSLAGVPAAIQLSRATMAKIRQNLFLAFIYNILAIPIAAGVLYPAFGLRLSPLIAAGKQDSAVGHQRDRHGAAASPHETRLAARGKSRAGVACGFGSGFRCRHSAYFIQYWAASPPRSRAKAARDAAGLYHGLLMPGALRVCLSAAGEWCSNHSIHFYS